MADRPDTEGHDLDGADLAERYADARRELADARREVARLRSGRAYLAARAVAAARRDRSRLPGLPRDLWRVARSGGGATTTAGEPAAGTDPVSTLGLPRVPVPNGPVVRPGLRVATILDPFSAMAFRFEWDQVEVGPDDWRAVFEAAPPQLLFCESTWRGNGGRWSFAMTAADAPKPALRELVAWCREHHIPTVFWNKEDPPNYDKFIATARLFDHVFTVDADCLPRYREDLGHDRVGLLPFAAQPRIHNPVLHGAGRIYDVAFAGTYFADKHPARRAQMEWVLEPARAHDLHIFSRLHTEGKRYQFPAEYQSHIVGTVAYEDMLQAYKAYKVFLNVNSVTASPTMGSRRLFELAAAGTPVVSGPAASIQTFFGDDLIVITESQEQTSTELRALLASAELRDRVALRASRRVLSEHTFSHRVDTVLATVGIDRPLPTRSVSAVVPTMRAAQLDNVFANLARQTHPDLELVLVLHGLELDPAAVREQGLAAGVRDLTVVTAPADLTLGACMNLGVDKARGDDIAKMDDDNYYGPEYLADLARAFSYTDAGVVGKWAHYVLVEAMDAVVLRFASAEHRYTSLVQGGTMLVRGDLARELRFEDVPRAVDTTFLAKVRDADEGVYSADRFNFVSVRRTDTGGHTWKITDTQLLSRASRLEFYGDPLTHVTV